MLVWIGIGAVLALAFANGANDNAKPVATLVGAGLTTPRKALIWGTIATLCGSVAGIVLGRALMATFSAKGLVNSDLAASVPFLVSVAVGAGSAVLLATRVGIPISTTHALIGAIVGVGVLGGALDLGRAGAVLVVPLLTSPLIAMALTAVSYPPIHRLRAAMGVSNRSCIWLGATVVSGNRGGGATAALAVRVGDVHVCRESYTGRVLGLEAGRVAAAAHWLSALSLSFGRGLQDAAKIAGIGIVLAGPGLALPIAAGIALAMAAGGLLAARRVEQTMAHRITRMNDGQGLLANAAATCLVFAATALGLPVSTTHVTTGAMVGLRAHEKRPAESWLGRILLAWVATLPLAAAIAALVWWIASAA